MQTTLKEHHAMDEKFLLKAPKLVLDNHIISSEDSQLLFQSE
jgi:hypothetical protein